MLRHSVVSVALLGIIATAGTPVEAAAQDGADDAEKARTDWHLTETRKGFCIQLLLDPAKLRDVPDGVRLLPAEGYAELHPVLRGVVTAQPEYKTWSPSSLCFYYLGRVVGASEKIGGDPNPAKAPVLGIWTVAGVAGTGRPGNIVLDLRSNDGDLRDAAEHAGLEPEKLTSTIGPVPREDGPPRPEERRYQIKLGKTLLVWDGKGGEDTTATPAPVSWVWEARGQNRRWITGQLTLKPAASTPMLGSLRVEGNDPVARALQASPIRYVGPSYEGGEGELRLR
jgi:hypothetical protein